MIKCLSLTMCLLLPVSGLAQQSTLPTQDYHSNIGGNAGTQARGDLTLGGNVKPPVVDATADQLSAAFAAQGRGDFATELKLLRPLADKGNATAQFMLGGMYFSGHGVPQSLADAASWFRRAAEQGLAPAQANLGVMYFGGQGVAQDFAEAAKWFQLAGAQGEAKAQFNVGWMYEHGRGVAQDPAEALKWYRLAAAQGYPKAQFNLGVLYEHGTGVAQDYVRSHMWYDLASTAGDADAAKYRDLVAGKMTAENITAAQSQAAACLQRKFSDCN